MKNVLWTALEISVNVYVGILVTYFVYKFLGNKEKFFSQKINIFFGLLYAAAVTAMNYITIYEGHIGTIIYIAILFVYALLLKGSLITKIFASILPQIILFVVSITTHNIIIHNFGLTFEESMKPSLVRLLILISVQTINFCLVKLVLYFFSKENFNVKKIEGILVFVVLGFSIIIIDLLHRIGIKSDLDDIQVYNNFILLLLFFINIIIYVIIIAINKKNNQIKEMEILKIHSQYQEKYVENARLQYDSISKITHDLKNHFSVLHILLSDNKLKEAKDYIEKNLSIVDDIEQVVNTNNDVANAVINYSLTAAKAMDIKATCVTVKEFGSIDQIDLCNLLSNLLDNAVTACINNKSDTEKNIIMQINSEDNIYTFVVKNTIDESVLKNNPKLLTSKKNKTLHGYGIKIIKEITEKYNGRCDFYEEEDLFCCRVSLRL